MGGFGATAICGRGARVCAQVRVSVRALSFCAIRWGCFTTVRMGGVRGLGGRSGVKTPANTARDPNAEFILLSKQPEREVSAFPFRALALSPSTLSPLGRERLRK